LTNPLSRSFLSINGLRSLLFWPFCKKWCLFDMDGKFGDVVSEEEMTAFFDQIRNESKTCR